MEERVSDDATTEGLERFTFGPDSWPGGTWRLRRDDEDGEWVRCCDATAALSLERAEKEDFGRTMDIAVERAEKAESDLATLQARHEAAIKWAREGQESAEALGATRIALAYSQFIEKLEP